MMYHKEPWGDVETECLEDSQTQQVDCTFLEDYRNLTEQARLAKT